MKKQIIYSYDAQDLKLIKQETIGPRATARSGYTEAYDKFVQEQEEKVEELQLTAQRDLFVSLTEKRIDLVHAMTAFNDVAAQLEEYGLTSKVTVMDIAKSPNIRLDIIAHNFVEDIDPTAETAATKKEK